VNQTAVAEFCEALPDALVVVDPETEVVQQVNERASELFGRDEAALVGERFGALCDGRPGAAPIEDRLRGGLDGERTAFEGWIDPPTGDRRFVEARLGEARVDGETAVVASIRDTGERRVYEQELEQYRRRLDGAMFAGDLAWWEMDVETGSVRFHEHKAQMLGYSPERFDTYEDFTELVHPDDHDRAMQAMRDHLEGDAEKYDVEYRIETADGSYRWFHDVGGVTKWDDGAPRKVTGIVVDVSGRKEAERRLREKNEQLTLLNRVVRHDIRNDMGVALGWLNVVADEASAEVRARLERVEDAAEHAVELTHSVGDLMNAIEGDEATETRPVELRPALESQIERARESYGHATVEVASPLPDVPVRANAMLSSVFDNLLTNAVRHSDRESPTVTVEADVRDETVRIAVADDGPGVPDDRKAEIFSRGERSLESSGSGLGLYLVATLVDAYGGDVWVEDREPTGAVFCVELPTAGDDPDGER
jgi:PAS domain S-box-containing protein